MIFQRSIKLHFIVYDFRVGRTGRAGRSGVALTLLEPTQV